MAEELNKKEELEPVAPAVPEDNDADIDQYIRELTGKEIGRAHV